MTVDHIRTGQLGTASGSRPSGTLTDRIAAGEPYAISFGGQGAPWLPTLAELVVDADLEYRIGKYVDAAERLIAPVAGKLAIARPDGFHPLTWVRAHDAGDGVPTDIALADATLSVPVFCVCATRRHRRARQTGSRHHRHPADIGGRALQGCWPPRRSPTTVPEWARVCCWPWHS